MWLQTGNLFALISYFSGCRLERTGYQIKQGCFAGPVRADQSDNFALIDVEVDIMYGSQPAEVFGDFFSFEYSHMNAAELLLTSCVK